MRQRFTAAAPLYVCTYVCAIKGFSVALGVTRLIVNQAAASVVASLATTSSDFFNSVPYFKSVCLSDEDKGSKTFDDYKVCSALHF